ncbi:hypothetical protein G7Y89_g7754 [Cudoniella acicularis]|uniref:Uncharacterized protein n=1 Tax=Cudoniella acicularis TaxID=354080 RepID=A0A8H4RKM1_9HELO|nr:hypothetical protein G7Y89_g7754 [Cudoniella acicularis]
MASTNYTTLSTTSLAAAKQVHDTPSLSTDTDSETTEQKPIYMLNLLRFRPIALYPSSSTSPLSPTNPSSTQPLTGQAAYHTLYIPSLQPIMASLDAKLIFFGKAYPGLVGPEREKWDEVGLVRYKSVGDFEGMIGSERYKKECEAHRVASLEEMKANLEE